MKESISTALQDKIVRLSIVLSIVLITIHAVLTIVFQQKFPPVVPFFNSFPWGKERLVSSNLIMVIPPVLIGIFLLNNLLSFIVYKKHTLLGRILSFNALLVVFLGILAFLQIIFLVF